MIRLKRFTKESYAKMRSDYLNVIRYEKIWEKAQDNYSSLPGGLRAYLTDIDKLEELLAGPRDMPVSFGGMGEYPTMREFFKEAIRSINVFANPRKRIGETIEYMTEDEKKCCEEVFDYDILKNKCSIDNDSKNIAYWLLDQLAAKTCPYCNRIYTMHLRRCGKGATVRAELDHFYPKSIYPYFAISLFNLIPSCGYCNRLKKDDAELFFPCTKTGNYSIIYPYDESFDEPSLTLSINIIPNKDNDTKVMRGMSEDFSVEFQRDERYKKRDVLVPTKLERRLVDESDDEDCKEFLDRVQHSIKLFGMESFYSEHRKEIARLINTRYIYSQCSIEMILRSFLEEDKDRKKVSARDIMYFAFLERDEWGQSPLNKLKHDVLRQLDILEEV